MKLTMKLPLALLAMAGLSVAQDNGPRGALRGDDFNRLMSTQDYVGFANKNANKNAGKKAEDLFEAITSTSWSMSEMCGRYAVYAENGVNFDGGKIKLTKIRGGDVGGVQVKGPYKFDDTYSDISVVASDFGNNLSATLAKAMEENPNTKQIGYDLGGMTLQPGFYRSDSAIKIANGTDLTLDAQGDKMALFVIQALTKLETGPNTKIKMAGGAKAKMVFWVADSGVSLGNKSTFQGSIMTKGQITVGEEASVRGCVLAKDQVTFKGKGDVSGSKEKDLM